MNRTVVVTGGSSGLGKAIAARFVTDGDSVLITGRNAAALDDAAREVGARGISCNASSVSDVEALVAELNGRTDVLVNMAGGNTDLRAGDSDDSLAGIAAAWLANLEANLLGTVLTTTAVLPLMSEGGSVINVSSIGAEYAGSSYGAAKAAVAAWTAGLSAQVGPRGITANAISPGYIQDTAFFRGQLTDERRAALIASTHNKRPGRPEDIAGTAAFLASQDARHITGQTIHVNGGAFTTR
jgi:NAD(P)-dependent dehydrogenase (short-subunit alcohol dehydrogenase family)